MSVPPADGEAMGLPTRIVIADDHLLLRQGLRCMLSTYADISVVAEAGRADEVEDAVVRSGCDVLLLDLQLDRCVLQEVASLARLTKVVVWTASEQRSDAVDAIRLGAHAVVPKRLTVEALASAIRAAAAGRIWMPRPLVAEAFLSPLSSGERTLTAREDEVVRFVAAGLRNGEIAARLGITVGTVKCHLNNIFAKLRVRRRLELALQFRRVARETGT
jgi:DNA-binding NarL/FixJ family response regulator